MYSLILKMEKMEKLELNEMQNVSGEGFWGGFCGALGVSSALVGAYGLIAAAAVPGAGWLYLAAAGSCGVYGIMNS